MDTNSKSKVEEDMTDDQKRRGERKIGDKGRGE